MTNILYNSRGHPFKIVDTYRYKGNTWCTILFIETGTIVDVRKSNVNSGLVKDRYAKDVCGVACIGSATKVDNLRTYTVWKNMIYRCYDITDKSYKWYGGVGVTVSEDWLCFENFLNDLPKIDRYDKQLFDDGLLELDKDFKINKKERASVGIYSLESCTFLTRDENISLIANKKSSYKIPERPLARATNGSETVYIYNVKQFCTQYNISKSSYYRRVSGDVTSSVNGWYIEREYYNEN